MTDGLKSFGIEWQLLLWQAVNFGILFGLLWKFFYKPVRKILSEREKKISESMNAADALEKKSRALEEEFKQKMTSERKEIEKIHARILLEQEQIKKDMRKKAEQEAGRVIEEARIAAEREKNEILDTIQKDVSQMVVSLTARILEREVDETVEQKLIQDALESLKKSST
jgi:F-type H+-transporting ATPase subunit b